MLMIRLQRFGKKSQPVFRMVVTDSHNSAKSGRFLEILGFYNPYTKERNVNGERALHWISHGAQVSGTAHKLLIREGILKGKKIDVAPKRKVAPVEAGVAPAGLPAESSAQAGEVADTPVAKGETQESAPVVESVAQGEVASAGQPA